MSAAKILIFDIEASNLDADFGSMLAFGYAWYGKREAKVISLLDTNPGCNKCKRVDAVDDAPLVKRVHPILCEADMLVTWYGREGRGFDARFLNTRIIDARLPKLPEIPHVDLYLTARDRLKLSSNRLANVEDFLQLTSHKTTLLKRVWRKAKGGDVASIKYVRKHCEQDVLVLYDAYEILLPYVKTHPRIAGYETDDGRGVCRKCGSARLTRQKRAVSVTKGVQYQFKCAACGGWETRPEAREKAA